MENSSAAALAAFATTSTTSLGRSLPLVVIILNHSNTIVGRMMSQKVSSLFENQSLV